MDALPLQLGEFFLEAILGRGGSGIVYDAKWGPRRVALKILHTELASTERVRTQFIGEARRLQAIGHPSVVKVLAVGELSDGRPYLAMERLEGETLAAVLARGPLLIGDALALFVELCDAVDALHTQGLIHRDLKPENVFVVGGRHAVLLDFGIAKELAAPASTTTMDGGVRGTPAYMAPERFFGQPAGVATDVYELAVTLYAMLAGRLPWDDVADPEARLSPQPLVTFDLPAPIPPDLDVAIRRAMSTRAQNRPGSPAALRDAVCAAASMPAAATPTAADTARMARDSTAQPDTVAAPSWFAERHTTTDRGKTPLAWVPADVKPAAPGQRRRRLPFVAVGIATVGLAASAIAWRVGQDDASATSDDASGSVTSVTAPADAASAIAVDDANVTRGEHDAGSGAVASSDPWDQPVPDVVVKEPPKLALVGPTLGTHEARTQIVAALAHVPADTHVLFTIALGELRANEQFADILSKIEKTPSVAVLAAGLPACVRSVVSGADWGVFASQALDDSRHATLIVRGRWTRKDIEHCFAEDSIPLGMPDGTTMLQLRRVGWIDFIDDHTVYLSVRDDLAAAQVHDLVRHGSGPTAHAKQLLATLPSDRAIAIVIDGSAGLVWPKEYLPKASDVSAWLRLDTFSELEVVADTHSVAAATKLVADVRPTFDDLFKERESSILGSIKVVRDKTAMRIRGKLSTLMVAMISSSIP